MVYKISYSKRFSPEHYVYRQNVRVKMNKEEYKDFLKGMRMYDKSVNHAPMQPNATIFTCLIQRNQIMNCLKADTDKRFIRNFNTSFYFEVK